MIQCESKKYLVRTKSKSMLVDTKKEVGTKTKHRRLKGRKRKHGHHKHRREFGGDYSDNNEWLSKCRTILHHGYSLSILYLWVQESESAVGFWDNLRHKSFRSQHLSLYCQLDKVVLRILKKYFVFEYVDIIIES